MWSSCKMTRFLVNHTGSVGLVWLDDLSHNSVTPALEFQYACCLSHTPRNKNDLRKAVKLFAGLYASREYPRDCLFYLGQVHLKLGEFNRARQYVEKLIQLEPENRQARALLSDIEKKAEAEGAAGAGIVAGVLAVGLAVTAAFVFGRKR
eukprot:m.118240 g.118240  ORF g.118240 m.118240 type:complete len:150 (+) comp23116_c1_seq1:984-1433(+)